MLDHADGMSEEVAGGMSDTETRRVGEDPPGVRVVRILDDFLKQRERGEAVTRETLLARHPDLADELREHLEVVEGLTPGGGKIEDLIAQHRLTRSADPRYLAELGPYKITALIGDGGMGIVLKAYEESLNRTVALKILRPELAREAATVARFEREAKTAAALKHPNIVTVYAVGRERGVHYIAMEYVDGHSLAELIREREARRHEGTEARSVAAGLRTGRSASGGPDMRGLPTEAIRHIFRQLLAALGAAHAAGLIHRDVKSSNILLERGPGIREQGSGIGERGSGASEEASSCLRAFVPSCLPQVKLADFGLARMRSSQTQLTVPDSILGTPEYMSPEQARGDEEIDHRSDLYSAGVVLYEMLTGRTPFRADTPTATLRKIIDEEPPDPCKLDKDVDPVLASLALRLMAKRREDRFGSAQGASAALEAGQRVHSREKRRRGLWRLGMTLLAVALLTGFGTALNRIVNQREAASSDPEMKSRITNVKVDGESLTRVWVERDYMWEESPFHDFPPEVHRVQEQATKCFDLDGGGKQAVVAGLSRPLDGNNLFAFDASGGTLWRLPVSNYAPRYQWSDCSPSTYWQCHLVVAGDLDGQTGDELVAVARDTDEYPARISLIDPRENRIVSTFWHTGHIIDVQIAADFLGPGCPAIIAWGLNNTLDGFRHAIEPSPHDYPLDEDPPNTSCDMVCVVMVLDPAKGMDGLGPPRTRRKEVQDIGLATPFAYAFLDGPKDVHTSFIPEGESERRLPREEELRFVVRFDVTPSSVTGNGPRQMKIFLDSPSELRGAILTVDSNLNALSCKPAGGAPESYTKHWLSLWRPIIQNREYLTH